MKLDGVLGHVVRFLCSAGSTCLPRTDQTRRGRSVTLADVSPSRAINCTPVSPAENNSTQVTAETDVEKRTGRGFAPGAGLPCPWGRECGCLPKGTAFVEGMGLPNPRGCLARSWHAVDTQNISQLVFYQHKPSLSATHLQFPGISSFPLKFPSDGRG